MGDGSSFSSTRLYRTKAVSPLRILASECGLPGQPHADSPGGPVSLALGRGLIRPGHMVWAIDGAFEHILILGEEVVQPLPHSGFEEVSLVLMRLRSDGAPG